MHLSVKIRTRVTKIVTETCHRKFARAVHTIMVYSACERRRSFGCLVLFTLQLSMNRFCTKQVHVQLEVNIRDLKIKSFLCKPQNANLDQQFAVRSSLYVHNPGLKIEGYFLRTHHGLLSEKQDGCCKEDSIELAVVVLNLIFKLNLKI